MWLPHNVFNLFCSNIVIIIIIIINDNIIISNISAIGLFLAIVIMGEWRGEERYGIPLQLNAVHVKSTVINLTYYKIQIRHHFEVCW